MNGFARTALTGSAAFMCVATASSAWAQSKIFNIPAQSATTGIAAFGQQADVQIAASRTVTQGKRTKAVKGEMSVGQALSQLLDGTGLQVWQTGVQTWTVVAARPTSRVVTHGRGTAYAALGDAVGASDPDNDAAARSAGSSSPASVASSQHAEPPETGDIVVTANRRETSINKVPISVSAMTQESLDRQGIKRIDDLARTTPGISFQRSSFAGIGNRSQISIRGIESNVGASTTGIYIDDTPIQTRNAGYTSTSVFPAIFDLERTEVLRGPQGTLFGSGSEGGTVRFITPDPGLSRFSTYDRAELSFTKNGEPSYEVGSAVGAPIVEDRLGVRLSAFFRRDGGWIDRVDRSTGKVLSSNQNSNESIVLRAALTWAPTSSLKITPSFYYQDLDSQGGDGYWESLSDAGAGRFLTGNAIGAPSSDKFKLPALKVEYDFGGATLVSNSSYLSRDAIANPDYTQFVRAVTTGSAFPLIPGEFSRGYFIDEQKGFTQEVRLQSNEHGSRLHWVLGLFYNRTRQVDTEIISSPFFPQIVLDTYGVDYITIFGNPLGARDSVYTDEQRTKDKQIAGFGQVDYDITDKLKATVGLRYAKVDFSFTSRNEGPFAGVATNTGSQSEKPLTPKFGISYQADGANLYYASAAKGFRPGGAQRRPPSSCASDLAALGITSAPETYDADSVWSYEVGTKNRLFGRSVNLATSAFWINWNNIQQNVPLNACGQSFVGNLGKAVSRGFDIAIDARIGDFTLGLSGGYTDAHYTQSIISGTAVVALKGEEISTISPWVAHISGQYDFALADHDGYVRLDYDYRSKGAKPNIAVFGVDPLLFRRPETHFFTARAGVDVGGLDVSLFVDNLFNAHPLLSRTRDIVSSTLIYGSTFRPRRIGVTLSYRK
ncbi:TonB-dependent receptor [Rhizorhabdus wittichii DC-6]|nr:TonB-dependent receptor [Rhizorhabdus wittichii DC-6]